MGDYLWERGREQAESGRGEREGKEGEYGWSTLYACMKKDIMKSVFKIARKVLKTAEYENGGDK
jgi:hypothetical protein